MKTIPNDSLALDPNSLPTTHETSVIVVPQDESISIYEVRSNRRRLLVLILLALAGLILPFSDAVYLPSLAEIERDLHASTLLVDYTVSAYMIAAGISTLLWGPLGDKFGRKIILLIAIIVFLALTIVCIFARTIVVLLIFRSLQGAAISASFVVGQSAIVDIYPSDRLGFAMGLFLVPLLVGPILGPFVGGALSDSFGWRSTFVLLAIMAVVCGLLILLFVPETHHYFVLQGLSRAAEKKRSEQNPSSAVRIREAATILEPHFSPPWRPFVFLFDITIAPHVAVCSVNFATLFISLILISNREAQKPYGLSPFHIGLTYIATGTSSLVGSLLGGWISDWSAKRFSQAVEGRLILSVVGSLLCPLGLLLCGWSFHFGIHLAVPLIGSALFCFGEAFMYTSVCAFVNVKKPATAGAILALTNSLCFLWAGIGIIAAVPLLILIPYGPLFSLLAGIAFILICISGTVVIYHMRRLHSTIPSGIHQNGSSSEISLKLEDLT